MGIEFLTGGVTKGMSLFPMTFHSSMLGICSELSSFWGFCQNTSGSTVIEFCLKYGTLGLGLGFYLSRILFDTEHICAHCGCLASRWVLTSPLCMYSVHIRI